MRGPGTGDRGLATCLERQLASFSDPGQPGARLQLDTHRTRIDTSVAGGYAELEEDERFRWGSGAGQAIATSTAMADGGLFNLDFRDERYLPFEYSGAISRWTLTLPSALRQFDYRTIDDVIVHIDYTARDGIARDVVESSLVARLNSIHGEDEPLALLVRVDAAFPNEWERFFGVEAGVHLLSLPMEARHFPHVAQRRGFEFTKVGVALMLAPELESPSIAAIATSRNTLASASANSLGSVDWGKATLAKRPAGPSLDIHATLGNASARRSPTMVALAKFMSASPLCQASACCWQSSRSPIVVKPPLSPAATS